MTLIVVILDKAQTIAPMVLQAKKILLLLKPLVDVDGEDPTAIIALKPMVVVDGEDRNMLQKPLAVDGADQVFNVYQPPLVVDGEDQILPVPLLQVEVPLDLLPHQILRVFLSMHCCSFLE